MGIKELGAHNLDRGDDPPLGIHQAVDPFLDIAVLVFSFQPGEGEGFVNKKEGQEIKEQKHGLDAQEGSRFEAFQEFIGQGDQVDILGPDGKGATPGKKTGGSRENDLGQPGADDAFFLFHIGY